MPWFVLDCDAATIERHPSRKADGEGPYIEVVVHELVLRLRAGEPVDVPEISRRRFMQRVGWFGESMQVREMTGREVAGHFARAGAPPPEAAVREVVIEKRVLLVPPAYVLDRCSAVQLRKMAEAAGIGGAANLTKDQAIAALVAAGEPLDGGGEPEAPPAEPGDPLAPATSPAPEV